MHKAQVLAVVSVIMIAVAFTANHAIGRLQTDTLRRLTVEGFPKKVGGWTMTEDRPTDAEVQQTIPTARIVDRLYEDTRGRMVNLTLLTATDYADFHDPNICFPGQGFTLGPREHVTIAGQRGALMTAERDDTRLRIMYWWSGRAAIDTKYGREQMGKILAVRDRLVGQQGHSLFVRVLVPEDAKAMDTIRDFLQACGPALSALTAEK